MMASRLWYWTKLCSFREHVFKFVYLFYIAHPLFSQKRKKKIFHNKVSKMKNKTCNHWYSDKCWKENDFAQESEFVKREIIGISGNGNLSHRADNFCRKNCSCCHCRIISYRKLLEFSFDNIRRTFSYGCLKDTIK